MKAHFGRSLIMLKAQACIAANTKTPVKTGEKAFYLSKNEKKSVFIVFFVACKPLIHYI